MLSTQFIGPKCVPVEVECHQSIQIPGMHIVGLNAKKSRELVDRVRFVLEISGNPLPARRFVLNFSSAAKIQDSAGFDLPVAVACLLATQALSSDRIQKLIFWGDLSLDGSLRMPPGDFNLEPLFRSYSADVLVVPEGCNGRRTSYKSKNLPNYSSLKCILSSLNQNRTSTWPKWKQQAKSY